MKLYWGVDPEFGPERLAPNRAREPRRREAAGGSASDSSEGNREWPGGGGVKPVRDVCTQAYRKVEPTSRAGRFPRRAAERALHGVRTCADARGRRRPTDVVTSSIPMPKRSCKNDKFTAGRRRVTVMNKRVRGVNGPAAPAPACRPRPSLDRTSPDSPPSPPAARDSRPKLQAIAAATRGPAAPASQAATAPSRPSNRRRRRPAAHRFPAASVRTIRPSELQSLTAPSPGAGQQLAVSRPGTSSACRRGLEGAHELAGGEPKVLTNLSPRSRVRLVG